MKPMPWHIRRMYACPTHINIRKKEIEQEEIRILLAISRCRSPGTPVYFVFRAVVLLHENDERRISISGPEQRIEGSTWNQGGSPEATIEGDGGR